MIYIMYIYIYIYIYIYTYVIYSSFDKSYQGKCVCYLFTLLVCLRDKEKRMFPIKFPA